MKNTYRQGSVTFYIYPEGKKFVGVCLELDIVEEADNLKSVEENLLDAVKTHLGGVIKNRLSEDLLNRPAPNEYWEKFFSYLKTIEHIREDRKEPEIEHTIVERYPIGALSAC